MRSKLGLKALGLCALALGLMAAFGGSVAQAEIGAKWAIVKANGELVTISPEGDGKGKGDTLLPRVNIKEIEALLTSPFTKHVVLSSKAVGVAFQILCTAASLEDEAGVAGVKLLLDGSLQHGRVRFSGCVILLAGVESKACEPHTGAELGVILTNLAKGLMVLHELAGGTKDELTRIEPLTGETFVTIETGAECAIGAKIPVIGKLFLRDSQNKFKEELVDHLIEQDGTGVAGTGPNLTKLWVFSKTAEHVSNISGSALITLTGEHAGLKWGGLPA